MRRDFFYRHPLTRKKIMQLLFFFATIGIAVLILIATFHMRPILTNMATSRVSNAVTRVVTEAVSETINGGVNYSDLIAFEKDKDGKITALKSNMAEFNRLQSKILDTVLEKLSTVSTRELAIPIGSLTGASLLSGRGPRLSVRMQSVGSSTAYLKNAFSSAGINQTKHQIILNVDVYVSILLPGFTTATKVSNTFIVAETVIVGSVPNTYTYFSASGDQEETAREYILNGP